jgi:hypothetical protein
VPGPSPLDIEATLGFTEVWIQIQHRGELQIVLVVMVDD